MKSSSSSPKKNRLIKEKSPYLLQHAVNPVDWYPWGEEAFEKARLENKPVFLSIGYSTCHWCHVMEHESFENQDIAAILNDHFISIKVDREERPDIDHLYMAAVQAISGTGGWPLSVFLTPDLKPFMGGTYFPPEDRWGRIGFKNLLMRINGLWKERRGDIDKSGEELMRMLAARNISVPDDVLNDQMIQAAFHHFQSRYDARYGGFGASPKFPSPHQLTFLLRYWKLSKNEHALDMVKTTLRHMARGGICDQLGGGFHRYSTDEKWLAPHFEKMLYDQALLLDAYIEIFQITSDPEFRKTAQDTAAYVLRDMQDAEGGFYSAEDADSEGEEGTFYLWDFSEWKQVLGEDADWGAQYFGVSSEGNFEGKNILHRMHSGDGARTSEDEAVVRLRKKLYEHRKRRTHPFKDDKILVCWNGLMIAALAKAGRAFDNPAYTAAAQKAAAFILRTLYRDGKLYRRYREGEAAIEAFQDDYACLIYGLIHLYQADFDFAWLRQAKHLANKMMTLFADAESGGFYMAAQTLENTIVRSKEYYDGASPSGNSVAAWALIGLAQFTGEMSYLESARKTVESSAAEMHAHPTAYAFMLQCVLLLKHRQCLIVEGDLSSAFLAESISFANRGFYPFLSLKCAGEELENIRQDRKRTEAVTAGVSICVQETCGPMIHQFDEFKNQIAKL